MKFEDNENIEYRDDNTVCFSRKKRTYTQRLISKNYDKFAPEDLAVETDIWDGNPSVNKKTWQISSEFGDLLDCEKYRLNKGGSAYPQSEEDESDILDKWFRRHPEIDRTIDGGDDYE